ncbi:membrane protein [Catellatospora sp. IY07-71]|uniref:FtsX-like permease family protein n=1 Tax=Catellatospora sp. IY07-71 TaxID=2728827 RepID=UPI001BB3BE8D|nr:FtsX-like permease family protein [Catellatospora sp. IY07-71]BCJ71955.1 membrane protein [Catellatospora sp. IY07-71]
MKGWIARVRAGAGPLALLGVLTLAAGLLALGAPRVANQLTDDGLRNDVSPLSYTSRDLTYRATKPENANWDPQRRLEQQQAVLYPALRERVTQSWWALATVQDESFVRGTGLPERTPPLFSVRAGSGLEEQADLVEGRWPHTQPGENRTVEVVLTKWNAEQLEQRVGSTFRFHDRVPMEVVGIIEPHDENGTYWEPMPTGLRAYLPNDDGDPYRAVVFSDQAGLALLEKLAPVVYEWRYRIDTATLDMAVLPAVVEAANVARRQGIESSLTTGLDTALARFAERARAAQALLAVVQVGALVTLAGLVLLAARVLVSRRRAEFALLRARGGAILTIGSYTLLESLLVVPAAIVGALAGTAVPGRPAATWPVLAVFTALAVLAVPVMTMRTSRDPSFSGERADVASTRVGLKRRTAELSLLVLAGAGVWLLRERGLSESGEVDVYLAAVPALLAAGAAVAMVRVIPPVVAWLGRLAVRRRGAVGFLGLSRAGRTAGAVIGPVAVLVVAVSTAVFSVAVAGTIDSGRDRATDLRMAADVKVDGYYFDERTATELAAVPGVTAVAPYMVESAGDLAVDQQRKGTVYALVLDGPAYAKVLAESGVEVTPPAAFTEAGQSPVIPALVSPGAAKQIGDGKPMVTLRGRFYDFSVAAVVDGFPPIANGATNFVVLPWQAFPADSRQALLPSGYLLAGDPDPQALRAVGDAGQERWASTGYRAKAYEPVTQVTTWDQTRASLDETSVNAVITFAFAIGAGTGVVLALLAIGFAVVSGARGRGTVLSRLRTMGLTRGQGRGLLLVELMPVVTVAVLTGAAVGVAMPRLIAPALGLDTFTDGITVGVAFDPLVAGAAVALVLIGMLTALAVETLFNRRLRLGEVLRLGSFEAGES